MAHASDTSAEPYRRGDSPFASELSEHLFSQLNPLGFVVRSVEAGAVSPAPCQLWVRKTFNTNRAVALLELPPSAASCAEAGRLSQALKLQLGKAAGYFPFFYGVGIQVVWFGPCDLGNASGLSAYVDAVDNQRAIVQSIFVFDTKTRKHAQARTWGQIVTGRFQDAIERGLAEMSEKP